MPRPTRCSRPLLLLLLAALTACGQKSKPVAVPAELSAIAQWLHDNPYQAAPKEAKAPPPVRVLTLSDGGAAAVRQAGGEPFQEAQGQAWLLARDVTALMAGMEQEGLHYLLTPEPDLRDAPTLLADKATLVPSVLRHLQTVYGTGTRDQACVNRLQLVAASPAIHDLGGRHLPAALLFRRVPGALLRMTKLVPGIPVRVETTRAFAGQVFVFDCQTRADANGMLEMRFPYASLPDRPVKMWTAVSKGGDVVEISADAVTQGKIVDLTQ